MKRVLYIQHTAGTGGCFMTLLRLLEKMDRTRFEPSVLFLQDGPGVALIKALGIITYIEPGITYYPHGEGAFFPVRSFQPWLPFIRFFQILTSAIRTFNFIKEHPVDLVHINSMVMLGSLWGAHRAGVPIVLHVREVLAQGTFGFRRTLIQKMIDRFANRVIAIAFYNAAQLKPSPKTRIIYDTVDFSKFDRNRKDILNDLGLHMDAGSPVVGMLGGTVPHKGIETFLKAAALIHQQRPTVLFLVAGYPPIPDLPVTIRRWVRHRLEDLLHIPNLNRSVLDYIHSKQLENSVIFTGPRLDIPNILANLEVLIFPATVSHFGLPIIEAGAMGKPVIVSDFPSTREIVFQNVTGLLVPPNDPNSLAKAVLQIFDNPSSAEAMGEAGYQQSKQKFNADLNIPGIFAVYDELI
jgi:glycosyltransferase involved in cell wall biosynthesis